MTVQGTVPVAILALAAGADLVCLGHDLHEQAVEAVHAAICTAVASGRIPLERLAEAVARVEALARRTRPDFVGTANGAPGAEAARRALRSLGEARLSGPPLVVELVPADNIAAGPREHSSVNVCLLRNVFS